MALLVALVVVVLLVVLAAQEILHQQALHREAQAEMVTALAETMAVAAVVVPHPLVVTVRHLLVAMVAQVQHL
jgi:hypothetical protein